MFQGDLCLQPLPLRMGQCPVALSSGSLSGTTEVALLREDLAEGPVEVPFSADWPCRVTGSCLTGTLPALDTAVLSSTI